MALRYTLNLYVEEIHVSGTLELAMQDDIIEWMMKYYRKTWTALVLSRIDSHVQTTRVFPRIHEHLMQLQNEETTNTLWVNFSVNLVRKEREYFALWMIAITPKYRNTLVENFAKHDVHIVEVKTETTSTVIVVQAATTVREAMESLGFQDMVVDWTHTRAMLGIFEVVDDSLRVLDVVDDTRVLRLRRPTVFENKQGFLKHGLFDV